MTQTTIIAGLGLSVFALSTFTPTQRFGTLMLALLAAALVGDLIFLPALLASPLGRIFTMRIKPDEQLESTTESSANEDEDDDGEYQLAESEAEDSEQNASESSEAPAAAKAEVPKLKIRRPQLMRDPPTKARRRNTSG